MDFFKEAESFIGSQGQSDSTNQAESYTPSQSSGSTTEAPVANHRRPTNVPADAAADPAASGTNIYSSAETLYTGLTDELTGKQSSIDNQQLAKAASDVLRAADNYGFAKNSPYEQYFNKAEDYLDGYGNPKGGAPARNDPSADPSYGR